jgi:hypothetical protein
MTFHGDPLRDPLIPPKEDGMVFTSGVSHLSIFFVYPKNYYPPFLGKWEFNIEPEQICSNFEKMTNYFTITYECKGHANAHIGHDGSKDHSIINSKQKLIKMPILSYHGDPTCEYRFRLLQPTDRFPEWHPNRYHL